MLGMCDLHFKHITSTGLMKTDNKHIEGASHFVVFGRPFQQYDPVCRVAGTKAQVRQTHVSPGLLLCIQNGLDSDTWIYQILISSELQSSNKFKKEVKVKDIRRTPAPSSVRPKMKYGLPSIEPRSCPPHLWLQSMSPGSSEPSPSGNEHMRPRNVCLVLGLNHVGGNPYHVSSKVGFFVLLEALKIIQHTRASILDILFGHFQRLLQLK